MKYKRFEKKKGNMRYLRSLGITLLMSTLVSLFLVNIVSATSNITTTLGNYTSMIPYLGFIISPIFLYFIFFLVITIVGIVVSYYLNPSLGLLVVILSIVVSGIINWIPIWVVFILSLALFYMMIIIGGEKDER